MFYQNRTIQFSKPDHPIFPDTTYEQEKHTSLIHA
jgi:hypothetical protein